MDFSKRSFFIQGENVFLFAVIEKCDMGFPVDRNGFVKSHNRTELPERIRGDLITQSACGMGPERKSVPELVMGNFKGEKIIFRVISAVPHTGTVFLGGKSSERKLKRFKSGQGAGGIGNLFFVSAQLKKSVDDIGTQPDRIGVHACCQ